MEQISLKTLSQETKIAILEELGYDSDGTWVLTIKGEKVLDRYTNEPVKVSNCLILPGSTIIIDNNPLSIAAYLEEFGDAPFSG